MGWRFRSSIRLAPGIRLNLGKTGVTSLSVGGRGFTTNIGSKGVSTTVGLPGTGLSYRHQHGSGSSAPYITPTVPSARRSPIGGVLVFGVLGFVIYLASGNERHSPTPTPARSSDASQTASAPARVGTPSEAPPATALLPPIASLQPGMNSEVPAKPPLREAITLTGANARSLPSMSGAVNRVLPADATYIVLKVEGNWIQVGESGGAAIGWVHSTLLR